MLFIDPVCPAPYGAASLTTGFLGGTEATVVRVLSGMPEASVMQHNRTQAEGSQYRPLDWRALPHDGPIVVLRSVHAAFELRQHGWRGRIYLWLHDLMDIGMALALPHIHNAGIELITVSNWHRDQIIGVARAVAGLRAALPKFHVIYNPLDPSVQPKPIATDPNRLICLSMANKGLYEILQHFQTLRERHPELELHLADAGQANIQMPGVRVLGLMPHAQAMEAMAGAFCMLYPNVTQPETFGIVYAEANALGVPALAHDFGAASEILNDPRQLVDAFHPTQLIERFESWRRDGRPQVQAREVFKLSNIVQAWRALAA